MGIRLASFYKGPPQTKFVPVRVHRGGEDILSRLMWNRGIVPFQNMMAQPYSQQSKIDETSVEAFAIRLEASLLGWRPWPPTGNKKSASVLFPHLPCRSWSPHLWGSQLLSVLSQRCPRQRRQRPAPGRVRCKGCVSEGIGLELLLRKPQNMRL